MNNSNDFYSEIFHFNKIPVFYTKLINTLNDDVLLTTSNNEKPKQILKDIHIISDVPSYMQVVDAPFKFVGINRFIVRQHNGLLIDFKDYNNFEDFFKNSFGSKNRQLLRRGIKALDTCFNIKQKVYYGSIHKEEYDKIFDSFYYLLKARFLEKEINNMHLNRWDYFTALVYPMILNKTASLFVIYDNKTPIAISLNFHLRNIVFPHIVTYNIDYSKFRLGHALWIYFIEWCFQNGIKFLDLSKGNYDYLKQLANTKYQMNYEIFYHRKNIISFFKAIALVLKLRFKQFVRDKNIHQFGRKLIGYFYKPNLKKQYVHYTLIKFNESLNFSHLEKLDLDNNQFLFFKRILFDILYKTSENIKDINLFKSLNQNKIYYYKGKKEIFKIVIY